MKVRPSYLILLAAGSFSIGAILGWTWPKWPSDEHRWLITALDGDDIVDYGFGVLSTYAGILADDKARIVICWEPNIGDSECMNWDVDSPGARLDPAQESVGIDVRGAQNVVIDGQDIRCVTTGIRLEGVENSSISGNSISGRCDDE